MLQMRNTYLVARTRARTHTHTHTHTHAKHTLQNLCSTQTHAGSQAQIQNDTQCL